jgi:multiple sugar transport system permease protein
MKRPLVDRIAPYIMLIPGLIVVILFLVYPIIWSFIISFKDASLIEITRSGIFSIPGEFVGFQSYARALRDPLFYKALYNSFIFAIIYMPLSVFASRFLAILINRPIRGMRGFRTVIFMPYILSVVSASAIFLALFRNEAGLINGLRAFFGADPIPWLSNEVTAMPVIALMTSWRKMGYFMIIFLAGLQSIPEEVFEAAEIDGASSFQKTFHITVPLLSKMTWLVVVLSILDVFRVFGEPFVMTGGGPNNSTLTVPFLIYNEAFEYLRIGVSAALSYLLLIISMVFVIIQHYITKRNSNY